MTPNPIVSSDIIWEPPLEMQQNSSLMRFVRLVEERNHGAFNSFEALHRWSVANPTEFWSTLVCFLNIESSGVPLPVYESGIELTPLTRRWFPQLKLNFAENIVRHHGPEPAIIAWSEGKERRELSWNDLSQHVANLAANLSEAGIGCGDRVFGYLPNIPEAVTNMLATAAVGGVWSSCGTDYQIDGLLARLRRIQPRVIVAVSNYLWRGKLVSTQSTLAAITAAITSIQHVIIVDHLEHGDNWSSIPNFSGTTRRYNSLVNIEAKEPCYKKLPFTHPLYIMFSSGTTGMPKGIIHSAGGTLIEHLKELSIHSDIKAGDRLFYQTSTSWMMWNWMVSALALRTTILTYEGDPTFSNGQGAKCGDRIWQMISEEDVTHYGTKHLWIQSISGGTDIIGCFGLGCPIKPVVRGAIQSKSLGYDVRVFNQSGESVTGQDGELVCIAPAPSMPIGFINDPEGEQYRAAYFSDFPGVWRHGDIVEERATGELFFRGRSDTTLKPGGVRIATADVYEALARLPYIDSAIAVGYVPSENATEEIVLFVTLRVGHKLNQEMNTEISNTLRRINVFCVPALIIECPELPKTTNNKLSELSVKRIISGQKLGNSSALSNPGSLVFFETIARDLLRAKWSEQQPCLNKNS